VRLISPEQRAAPAAARRTAAGRAAADRTQPEHREIAVRHKQHFPLGVRRLLRGIGACSAAAATC